MAGNDPKNKDLTSVIDLAKNYTGPEPGSTDEDEAGMLMEERAIETIDAFESIEDYTAENPFTEVAEDDEFPPPELPSVELPAEPEPEPEPEPTPEYDALPDAAEDASPGTDFEINSNESSHPSDFDMSSDEEPAADDAMSSIDDAMTPIEAAELPELPADQAPDLSTELPDADFSTSPESLSEPEADFSLSPPDPEPEPEAEPEPAFVPETQSPPAEERKRPAPLPKPSILKNAVAAQAQDDQKKIDSLTLIRAYAQNISVGKPAVAAAFPFSLMITGALDDLEKAKLLDLLSTHAMGFSEVDLEPQLDSGRILLPRISEYAGVLIIQALRDANVSFQFGPSDSIFATESTASADDDLVSSSDDEGTSRVYAVGPLIAADEIPITTKDFIPGWEYLQILDTISVSAALMTSVVEAKHSSEYSDALDGLKRELRLRAYRRKAQGLIYFKIHLDALALPTHYRLTLTAAAVVRTDQWVRPDAVEPLESGAIVDDKMVAELLDPTHQQHTPSTSAEPPPPPMETPPVHTETPPPLPFRDAKDAIAAGPEEDVPPYEPEDDTFVLSSSEAEAAEPLEAELEPHVSFTSTDEAIAFESAIAEAIPEPDVHDTLDSLLDAEPNLEEAPQEMHPKFDEKPESARTSATRFGRVAMPDSTPEDEKSAQERLREEANQRPPRPGETLPPRPPKTEPPLATQSDGSAIFTSDDATRSGKIALPPDEPSFKGPPQIPSEAHTESEAMGVPEEQLRRPAAPPPPPPSMPPPPPRRKS